MFVMYTYDVEAGRTAIFRKILRKYLGHEQNSVFYGNITKSILIKLRKELNKSIRGGDEILEFVCENRHNMDIQRYTKAGRDSGLPETQKDDRHTKDAVIL